MRFSTFALTALLLSTTARAQAPAPAPAPVRTPGPVIGTNHGTTRGLVESAPEWGLGVQLGTRGSSGIVAQKMAFHDGALDFGLGFGGGIVSAYSDFKYFFEHDFTVAALPEAGGYNQTRGRFMPYAGAGLMAARGISVRVPLGWQYVMLRDPFAFYGGFVVAYGLIESDDLELRFQALAGARLLL